MGMTFEESNEYFQNKFETCFAWEVMKIFSGPPKVVFSWRHWAHMNTSSLTEETNGEGKLIELFGFTRATAIDGKLRDIEVYFDQNQCIEDMKAADVILVE